MAPIHPQMPPDRESAQADSQTEFQCSEIQSTKKRGRTPLPESQKVQTIRIFLRGEEADYLKLWDGSDHTVAVREALETLKSYRPSGPSSGGGNTHAAKLRPGTRTMLKRELSEARERIRELEEQLRQAAQDE
jgi:hypothetical protein